MVVFMKGARLGRQGLQAADDLGLMEIHILQNMIENGATLKPNGCFLYHRCCRIDTRFHLSQHELLRGVHNA